jgi:hypothetical protein
VSTVRDAASWLATTHPATLRTPKKRFTVEEISTIVDSLIRERTGVAEFDDDSNWFRDMGLD